MKNTIIFAWFVLPFLLVDGIIGGHSEILGSVDYVDGDGIHPLESTIDIDHGVNKGRILRQRSNDQDDIENMDIMQRMMKPLSCNRGGFVADDDENDTSATSCPGGVLTWTSFLREYYQDEHHRHVGYYHHFYHHHNHDNDEHHNDNHWWSSWYDSIVGGNIDDEDNDREDYHDHYSSFMVVDVIDAVVVIPCGLCVTMDYQHHYRQADNVTSMSSSDSSSSFSPSSDHHHHIILPSGLDIIGTLIFSSNDNSNAAGTTNAVDDVGLTMLTPFIRVQGKLQMLMTSSTVRKPITGTPSIRVVLTTKDFRTNTTANTSFVPHHDENNDYNDDAEHQDVVNDNRYACTSNYKRDSDGEVVIRDDETDDPRRRRITHQPQLCDVGLKSVVVAGGQLDIHGMDERCMTWTKLYDVIPPIELPTTTNTTSKRRPSAEIPLRYDDFCHSEWCMDDNNDTMTNTSYIKTEEDSLVFLKEKFQGTSKYSHGWYGGGSNVKYEIILSSEQGGGPGSSGSGGGRPGFHLRVYERTGSVRHGPTIDLQPTINEKQHHFCLSPNQTYLFYARIRMTNSSSLSSSSSSSLTECARGISSKCLSLRSTVVWAGGSAGDNEQESTTQMIQHHRILQKGEHYSDQYHYNVWEDYYAYFTFHENELVQQQQQQRSGSGPGRSSSSTTTWKRPLLHEIRLVGPSIEIDIEIDDVVLGYYVPPEQQQQQQQQQDNQDYDEQNDGYNRNKVVCEKDVNLIENGDAQSAMYNIRYFHDHPYPMHGNGVRVRILKEEEQGDDNDDDGKDTLNSSDNTTTPIRIKKKRINRFYRADHRKSDRHSVVQFMSNPDCFVADAMYMITAKIRIGQKQKQLDFTAAAVGNDTEVLNVVDGEEEEEQPLLSPPKPTVTRIVLRSYWYYEPTITTANSSLSANTSTGNLSSLSSGNVANVVQVQQSRRIIIAECYANVGRWMTCRNEFILSKRDVSIPYSSTDDDHHQQQQQDNQSGRGHGRRRVQDIRLSFETIDGPTYILDVDDIDIRYIDHQRPIIVVEEGNHHSHHHVIPDMTTATTNNNQNIRSTTNSENTKILGCWGRNSNILFTSHTTNTKDSKTRKIITNPKRYHHDFAIDDDNYHYYNEHHRRRHRLVQFRVDGSINNNDDDNDDPRVTTIKNDRVSRRIHNQTTSSSASPSYFAVEVALLSRNIVFEGDRRTLDQTDPMQLDDVNDYDDSADDDDDLMQARNGGHLMIMQTPNVIQRMNGIEFINFGRQGELGRYPIHFHLCDNIQGSVVSQNTIRNSNQRCIVIHGTHNVTVEYNVAYNTAGHCYITEDGGEIDNIFLYNLGSNTHSVELLPRVGETDGINPSTFWCTNPQNIWIGNIAAGSTSNGYWFEFPINIRTPTLYMIQNNNDNNIIMNNNNNTTMNNTQQQQQQQQTYDVPSPNQLPIRLFLYNVAHSNSKDGIRTYPDSYDVKQPPPEEEPSENANATTSTTATTSTSSISAILYNTVSYKNGRSGIRLLRCNYMTVVDSIVAYNAYAQIDIEESDHIIINNTNIIIVDEVDEEVNALDNEYQYQYQYDDRASTSNSSSNDNKTSTTVTMTTMSMGPSSYHAYYNDISRSSGGGSIGIELHTFRKHSTSMKACTIENVNFFVIVGTGTVVSTRIQSPPPTTTRGGDYDDDDDGSATIHDLPYYNQNNSNNNNNNDSVVGVVAGSSIQQMNNNYSDYYAYYESSSPSTMMSSSSSSSHKSRSSRLIDFDISNVGNIRRRIYDFDYWTTLKRIRVISIVINRNLDDHDDDDYGNNDQDMDNDYDDSTSSLSSLLFFNFHKARLDGINNAYLIDLDGSINPAQQQLAEEEEQSSFYNDNNNNKRDGSCEATRSNLYYGNTILSDTNEMTSLLEYGDELCKRYPDGGYMYCTDTCLRTVTFTTGNIDIGGSQPLLRVVKRLRRRRRLEAHNNYRDDYYYDKNKYKDHDAPVDNNAMEANHDNIYDKDDNSEFVTLYIEGKMYIDSYQEKLITWNVNDLDEQLQRRFYSITLPKTRFDCNDDDEDNNDDEDKNDDEVLHKIMYDIDFVIRHVDNDEQEEDTKSTSEEYSNYDIRTWPIFVETSFEPLLCPNSINEDSIRLHIPPIPTTIPTTTTRHYCFELIRQHTTNDHSQGQRRYFNGQYLDTRCLQMDWQYMIHISSSVGGQQDNDEEKQQHSPFSTPPFSLRLRISDVDGVQYTKGLRLENIIYNNVLDEEEEEEVDNPPATRHDHHDYDVHSNNSGNEQREQSDRLSSSSSSSSSSSNHDMDRTKGDHHISSSFQTMFTIDERIANAQSVYLFIVVVLDDEENGNNNYYYDYYSIDELVSMSLLHYT